MSSILLNVVDQKLCIRLTQTLLHLLWEGTALGLCAFAMTRFCRTATARMRYGIHAVTLALMALCVPVTFAWIDPADSAPSEQVVHSGIGLTPSAAATAPERSSFASGAKTGLMSKSRQLKTHTAAGDGFPAGTPIVEPHAQFVDAVSATNESRFGDMLRRGAPFAACAYLFGVAAMLGRLCCALWGGHRLRRCAVPVGDRELLSQIRLQARRIGLKVIPIVAYCERIAIPVVAGILRPMILLPAGVAAELDAEQLLVILAHEMAHIRRFDLLVNVLQRLLETVLFFHPAAWYVSRRLSIERENCCDDAVLQSGNESTRYASALIQMAEMCASARRPVPANQLVPLAASGTSGSQLKLRILRLLDGEQRPRLTRADALVLALMVALISATMAGVWRHAVAAQAKASEVNATVTFRVQGRVVDPDGKPMAGITVTIRRLKLMDRVRTMAARDEQLAQVTTDADGRYEFVIPADQLPKPYLGYFNHVPDWIQIAAKFPGYGIDVKNFAAYDRGQSFDLQLTPDTVVQGRILNLEGRPVAGVAVRVLELVNSLKVKSNKSAIDGWYASVSQMPIDPGKEKDDRFRTGRLDANFVFNKNQDNLRILPTEYATATTNAEGQFELRGLGTDRLAVLEFAAPNLVRSLVNVITRPVMPVQDYYDYGKAQTFYGSKFDYVIGPSAVVEGVVRNVETKRPLVGALVTTHRVASDVHLHVPGNERQSYPDGFINALTDSAGRFRLEGLPPVNGNEIKVYPPENEPYLVTGEILVPDSPGLQPVTLNVELRRAVWLTGRVYDISTNKPVQASIRYSPFWTNPFLKNYPQFTDDNFSVGFNNDRLHSTDAEGRFRIPVIPGRGVIAAKLPGGGLIASYGSEVIPEFASMAVDAKRRLYTEITCDGLVPSDYHSIREIEPAADRETLEASLPLDFGQSVKFTFVDPDGKPVRGVGIHSLRLASISTSTDSETVTLSGFSQEKPTVLIFRQIVPAVDFLPAGVRRDAKRELAKIQIVRPKTNGEAVNVQLEPLATVRCRLVDADGRPWPARWVQVTYKTDDGQTFGPYIESTSHPFPDRSFELELIPGCAYRLIAGGDEEVQYREVIIAENVVPKPGEVIDLGDVKVMEQKPVSDAKADAGQPAQDKPAVSATPKTTGYRLYGRVIDAQEKPIPGATISISAVKYPRWSAGPAEAHSAQVRSRSSPTPIHQSQGLPCPPF